MAGSPFRDPCEACFAEVSTKPASRGGMGWENRRRTGDLGAERSMTVEPTPKTPAPEEGAADQPPSAARPEGPPSQQAPVSRRQFLTFGGAAAAGLVVGGAVGYAVHQ